MKERLEYIKTYEYFKFDYFSVRNYKFPLRYMYN
jgi:hypothetical protein